MTVPQFLDYLAAYPQTAELAVEFERVLAGQSAHTTPERRSA